MAETYQIEMNLEQLERLLKNLPEGTVPSASAIFLAFEMSAKLVTAVPLFLYVTRHT